MSSAIWNDQIPEYEGAWMLSIPYATWIDPQKKIDLLVKHNSESGLFVLFVKSCLSG